MLIFELALHLFKGALHHITIVAINRDHPAAPLITVPQLESDSGGFTCGILEFDNSRLDLS